MVVAGNMIVPLLMIMYIEFGGHVSIEVSKVNVTGQFKLTTANVHQKTFSRTHICISTNSLLKTIRNSPRPTLNIPGKLGGKHNQQFSLNRAK